MTEKDELSMLLFRLVCFSFRFHSMVDFRSIKNIKCMRNNNSVNANRAKYEHSIFWSEWFAKRSVIFRSTILSAINSSLFFDHFFIRFLFLFSSRIWIHTSIQIELYAFVVVTRKSFGQYMKIAAVKTIFRLQSSFSLMCLFLFLFFVDFFPCALRCLKKNCANSLDCIRIR